MKMVIRGVKCSWGKVISGVPQRSVLIPVMFALYISDMAEGVNRYMSLLADDAKLLRRTGSEEDFEALQQDL